MTDSHKSNTPIFGGPGVPVFEEDCRDLDRIRPLLADPDFRAIILQCADVLKTKGADYTGNADASARYNRVINFYQAGDLLSASPFVSWFFYFFKHVTAIATFCKTQRLASESIDGRIVDGINYLLLLKKLVMADAENTAK